MSVWKYLLRTVFYYRRTEIALLLGLALAATTLIGSLTIGAAVKNSMAALFRQRLGAVQFVMQDASYVFSSGLAAKMQDRLDTACSAVLRVAGVVRGQTEQVNNAQVLGVMESFWSLGQAADLELRDDRIAVNTALAERLKLRVGDFITLRIRPLNPLTEKALLQDNGEVISCRLRVTAIVDREQFGAFHLQADQITPYNVFVSHAYLAEQLKTPQAANLLLIARSSNALSVERLEQALRQTWSFDDLALQWRADAGTDFVDLISSRIFIPAAIIRAAQAVEPQTAAALTYFVTQFSCRQAATPYSFITGVAALDPCRHLPAAMEIPTLRDDQLIINQWLAEDLHAGAGDTVRLTYWIVDRFRELQTLHADLTVQAVTSMKGPLSRGKWTPNFPGLAEVESCSQWDASIPIELAKIRPSDEAYWQTYRMTPKAFLNYHTAVRLFSSEQATATLLRFAGTDAKIPQWETAMLRRITPAEMGLVFRDAATSGRLAHEKAMNLGSLMLSLSMFVIVAAILLAVVLVSFSIQQRQKPLAALLALGLSPGQVGRLYLLEIAMMLFAALVLGTFLALFFAHAVLAILGGIWGEIGLTANLHFRVDCAAVFYSGLILAAVTLPLMYGMLRRTCRGSIASLLYTGVSSSAFRPQSKAARRWCYGLGGGFFVGAALCLWRAGRQGADPVVWVMAGAFSLLAAALAGVYLLLGRHVSASPHSLTGLAYSNIRRRPGRNTAVIALIALSFFLLAIVGVHYQAGNPEQDRRALGNFQLYGQSAFPVLYDLNDPCQAQRLQLTDDIVANCRFTACRLYQGDDASCLNLNRAQLPALLGVPVAEFDGRFEFLQAWDRRDVITWDILKECDEPEVLPAAADYNTIVWALGKKLGDTITYYNEQNEPVRVKLAASLKESILPGRLIVSDERLHRHFPHSAPRQVFLIELSNGVEPRAMQNRLEAQLENVGLTVQTTLDRLRQFRSVQNLYIMLFECLGALALIIGLGGIAIVLCRNCLERRQELAALHALGFSYAQLKALVAREYILLLLIALAIGAWAGFLAILPSWLTQKNLSGYYLAAGLAVIMMLLGGLVVHAAVKRVFRDSLIQALRNE